MASKIMLICLLFLLPLVLSDVTSINLKRVSNSKCGSENSWSLVDLDVIVSNVINRKVLRASSFSCASFPIKLSPGTIAISFYIEASSVGSRIEVLVRDEEDRIIEEYKPSREFEDGWQTIDLPIHKTADATITLLGFSHDHDIVFVDSITFDDEAFPTTTGKQYFEAKTTNVPETIEIIDLRPKFIKNIQQNNLQENWENSTPNNIYGNVQNLGANENHLIDLNKYRALNIESMVAVAVSSEVNSKPIEAFDRLVKRSNREYDNSTKDNGTEDDGTGDNGTEENGTPDNDTGDNGTEDNDTGDNGTGDNGTEDNGTEDNGTEDNGTEDNGTGDNGTEDNGTEDNGTGDNGTEDNGTEDNDTGDNGTGDNGTEDNGTEDNDTGDNGTEDNDTGDNGTGDNGTEDNGAEDNGTEDNGTEDNGTEDNGTGDNGTEDNGTGDNGTEDNGTGDNGTEDNGSGDNGTEDNGTGDNGTEDNGTEDNGTGDNGTGDNGTEDNGTEDNGTEDNGTEDNGTEDNGTGDNGTEDNGTEDNGTEDNGTGDNGTGDNGSGDNGTEDNGSGGSFWNIWTIVLVSVATGTLVSIVVVGAYYIGKRSGHGDAGPIDLSDLEAPRIIPRAKATRTPYERFGSEYGSSSLERD